MASERTPARRPDFEICVLLKGTKETATIGVAWMTPEGNLHVKFNLFSDLNECRGPDVIVTAFDRRRGNGN